MSDNKDFVEIELTDEERTSLQKLERSLHPKPDEIVIGRDRHRLFVVGPLRRTNEADRNGSRPEAKLGLVANEGWACARLRKAVRPSVLIPCSSQPPPNSRNI